MTGSSLKSLIPSVANATGMTEAAIYERQRALVRAGLLKAESGRGPGSGVKATNHSTALLLIALIATDSLSETGECSRIFAQLRNKEGRCPLTGKKTFVDAVAAILASFSLAKRVDFIESSHATLLANIVYADDVGLRFQHASQFGLPRKAEEPGLSVTARLRGLALLRIADDMTLHEDKQK
jgi:hypothetical protein